jgi:hypothetical protein
LGLDLAALEKGSLDLAMGVTPEFLSKDVLSGLVAELARRSPDGAWGPYLMSFFKDYEHTWTEFSLYWLWYLTSEAARVRHIPGNVYRFLESPASVQPELISAADSMFLVLQGTKLSLADCEPIYQAIAESCVSSPAVASRGRRTLWLIPGAHKTETTMVQGVLEANRHHLEHYGVHYLDREAFYKSALNDYLRSRDPVTEEEAKASLLELTNHSDGLPVAIVFLENIFGEPLFGVWTRLRPTRALYPGFEIGLRKFLDLARDSFDVRCMYFIQRQDEFLESFYLQCIHHGLGLQEKDYLQLLIGCNLSWKRIVDHLKAATPGQPVHVVPSELSRRGKPAYLRHILDRLEIPADLDRWNIDVSDRPSLSRQGLAIALAAFPHMERNQRADLAAYLLPRFNTRRGEPFSLFDDGVRAGIVERFAKENLELLREAGISEPEVVDHYARCTTEDNSRP